MSEIGVGKETLSHCTRCKLILAHIIVAMKTASTPDKVQCKTCKSTHAFKDPGQTKKKTSIDRVIKNAKMKTSGRSSQSETILDIWNKAMSVSTAISQEYSMKTYFKRGDLIAHPVFGQGIVEKLIDNNKIEVLFKDDYRTLMHNKT